MSSFIGKANRLNTSQVRTAKTGAQGWRHWSAVSPDINIFLQTRAGQYKEAPFTGVFSANDIEPTRLVKLGPLSLPVPRNACEVLRTCYGALWRRPPVALRYWLAVPRKPVTSKMVADFLGETV